MNKSVVFLLCLTGAMSGCANTYISIETTFVGKVEGFHLAGNGKAIIDWGDGSAQQIVILHEHDDANDIASMESLGFFSHTYNKIMHVKTITVTGNITWLNTGITTTVTAIDASRMPSLLFLECNDENLTALDVTKNTALTDLACGGNRLSTLDINKNTNLEFLYCAENQLTALDISKNTALKYLFVNGNKLSASALKAIFSALPSCTTEDACYVHCHDNPGYPELTEADLAIATARGWEVTE